MAATPEASVAQWKRDLVGDLKEKFEKYPVVGILDISGIPASQFQEMRDFLRGRAEIKVSRRVLLRISIEKSSEERPGLEELTEYLEGPAALIFTEMNPFKLWKLLDENKTYAPAKPGMDAPEDIVIPEGETSFSPGPVIGELQRAGVKARIQAGKVVVVEDSKIAEKGEPIPEEVVKVLSRFGIEPREIGFELKAAFEDGVVFPGNMLVVDEEETLRNIKAAHVNAFGLSLEIRFPTEENIGGMLSQAYSQAYNLSMKSFYFTSENSPELLRRASSEMLSLASVISSQDPEAVGEELAEMLSVRETSEKAKKEEEKPKEEEEEEETEEEGSEPGLGGLFG